MSISQGSIQNKFDHVSWHSGPAKLIDKIDHYTMPCCITQGSNSVGQETEGMGEKCGQEPVLCFLREGPGDAEYRRLGLDSVNNFGRLWSVGAVLSCLVPDQG